MAKKAGIVLRFRGVRGSHPVPGPHTVRYGGNTSCVEVQAGGHRILLDAGTGIISLGDELFQAHIASVQETAVSESLVLTILFSHMHYDHTQGLPFFKPLFFPSTTCFLFGPKTLEISFEEGLRRAMVSPYFPVNLEDLQSVRVIRSVKPSEVIVFQEGSMYPEVYNATRERHLYQNAPLKVWVGHSLAHPDGGVYMYRIEYRHAAVVYVTDTEGYVGGDRRVIQFARGADVLIHDSQYMPEEYTSSLYPVQGFGHSTCEMAAEVARAAGVQRLYLFHYDPQYRDEQIDAMIERSRSIFPNTTGAYEGLTVEI